MKTKILKYVRAAVFIAVVTGLVKSTVFYSTYAHLEQAFYEKSVTNQ